MKKIVVILLSGILVVIFLASILILFLYCFGIEPTILSSGSMEPKISIGDLCFVYEKYPIEKVKVGDIIAYKVPRQKVIHRVIEIYDDGFRLKGDHNALADRGLITAENYSGKYLFSLKKIGFLILKLESLLAKIIFVLFVVSISIIDYVLIYSIREEKVISLKAVAK